MSMLNTVKENVLGWSIITILVVIVSIILLKFQSNSSIVCGGGYTFNPAADLCVNPDQTVNTSLLGTHASLETAIGAVDEPISWISIVFVAVIGLGILGLFIFLMKKYGKM